MNRFATIPIGICIATATALPAGASAAEVQIAATGPVVELSISESVEARPDIAMVSAGVTTQAQTAVEAMQKNANAMTAVIAQIRKQGIAERDIQTSGINLGAQYDYDQETRRQVFRGYQVSNRVSVKLHDIARTGPVLDALVAAGTTDLSGPDWSVEDDSAARAQARKAAMGTAQKQAMDYARMAGFTGVRLLEISEVAAPRGPMPMLRVQAMDAAAKATPVQPGMVEAGVTVTVKYELTR
ncbi:MAG: hypothetical protein RLZZ08_1435 [Pseudomonadota bacterium]|jgi:uncharacterized protein YggE